MIAEVLFSPLCYREGGKSISVSSLWGLQEAGTSWGWNIVGAERGLVLVIQGEALLIGAACLWHHPALKLIQWTDSFEKTLKLGKVEGGRRRGRQRMRWWWDGITNSMDMSLSGLWELVMDKEPGVLQSMGTQRVRHEWVTELNWTELAVYHP